jgi:hypothetical protein
MALISLLRHLLQQQQQQGQNQQQMRRQQQMLLLRQWRLSLLQLSQAAASLQHLTA